MGLVSSFSSEGCKVSDPPDNLTPSTALATMRKLLCTLHTARLYFPRNASDAYLQEEDAKSLLLLLLLLTLWPPLLREPVRL